jgi:hypothetical protein
MLIAFRITDRRRWGEIRMSLETSLDSKQPKPEPKLTVCLGCFASILKQRVSMFPKQTEDQPKQFDREHILQLFTENFGFFQFFLVFFQFFRVFWFVSKQFCLFLLFRYRFVTPK